MIWARWGAALMTAAVGIGAFAAHALKRRLSPEMLAVFEVGVRYHAYHALGLFAVAWMGTQRPGGAVTAAGTLFLAGILLFSGSLYAYALTEAKPLVFVTPFGGFCFLAGWIAAFLAARPSA